MEQTLEAAAVGATEEPINDAGQLRLYEAQLEETRERLNEATEKVKKSREMMKVAKERLNEARELVNEATIALATEKAFREVVDWTVNEEVERECKKTNTETTSNVPLSPTLTESDDESDAAATGKCGDTLHKKRKQPDSTDSDSHDDSQPGATAKCGDSLHKKHLLPDSTDSDSHDDSHPGATAKCSYIPLRTRPTFDRMARAATQLAQWYKAKSKASGRKRGSSSI
jgi:hypothetical protein